MVAPRINSKRRYLPWPLTYFSLTYFKVRRKTEMLVEVNRGLFFLKYYFNNSNNACTMIEHFKWFRWASANSPFQRIHSVNPPGHKSLSGVSVWRMMAWDGFRRHDNPDWEPDSILEPGGFRFLAAGLQANGCIALWLSALMCNTVIIIVPHGVVIWIKLINMWLMLEWCQAYSWLYMFRKQIPSKNACICSRISRQN